ncbi:hypothetical protein DICVIV_13693 [Dictyocaulus viviparus]|uniref:Uncharacterized protein n=1 Tax=Dictyocaulus viviparus TaxID=29172 RepID=A0A0D8XD64_DICVI|nr:hypothetical protein DICVIV_13693 [Dictyocaulus viviparus]
MGKWVSSTLARGIITVYGSIFQKVAPHNLSRNIHSRKGMRFLKHSLPGNYENFQPQKKLWGRGCGEGTTNVVIANWSTSMWRNVLNKALRSIAAVKVLVHMEKLSKIGEPKIGGLAKKSQVLDQSTFNDYSCFPKSKGFLRLIKKVACEESSQCFNENWRCSGLILSGPGAVRFLTEEIACRKEERLEQHNCLSSHYMEEWSIFIMAAFEEILLTICLCLLSSVDGCGVLPSRQSMKQLRWNEFHSHYFISIYNEFNNNRNSRANLVEN